MKSRTAIVFGETGLAGKAVIDELMISDTYEVIKVFTRSKINYAESTKIRELVVDFDHPESF